MRRRKNKKFIIIILILFISIGFAYLSASLNITGLATIKRSVWDVHFENIVNENEDVLNIDTPAVISNNKLRVDFEVSLDQPGQEYSFYVDVLNNSTFDVALSNLSITGLDSSLENYIIPTVTYSDGITPLQNDILKENSLETLRVSVKYNDDLDANNLPTSDSDFQLSVQLTYIQADSNSKERKHLEYINRQTPGVISVGDEISIDTEHFYVVSSDDDKTVLLSKYNLNTDEIKQSENNNNMVTFSTERYWVNGDTIDPKYGIAYPAYVYDNNYIASSGSNYSIAYHVKNYLNYLKTYSPYIDDARLIEKEEFSAFSSTNMEIACSTIYWTGSAQSNDYIWYISQDGGHFGTNTSSNRGVRPIIEVDTNILKNAGFKVFFDSNGGEYVNPKTVIKNMNETLEGEYYDVIVIDETTESYHGRYKTTGMEFSKIEDSESPTGYALHTERVADGETGGGTFGVSVIEGEPYKQTYIVKSHGVWSIGHYRLGRLNANSLNTYTTLSNTAKASNIGQTLTNFDYTTATGDYFDLAYGKITHLLPETKRTGYTFAGWWTEKDGGTRINNTTKVTENKIYYAHWVEI